MKRTLSALSFPSLCLLLLALGPAGTLWSADDAAGASAAPPAEAPAPVTPAAGAGAGSEPASADDTARKLAETEDRLATALHSYSVLSDQMAQLKADAEKGAEEQAALQQQLEAARSTNAALQAQADASAEIAPLRSELRQAQDEAGALALENAQLRTRLALAGPSPGAAYPMPTRPDQLGASPANARAPGPATAAPDSATSAASGAALPGSASAAPAPSALTAAPAPAAASPAPAAGRTHVVVEGDTLTKIAKDYYGSASRWVEILNANRDVIRNEKSLVIGSRLRIP